MKGWQAMFDGKSVIRYTSFNEIPRFTREGSYMVDMPFEYLIKWIDNEIHTHDLQLNPDFQRGHVWTKRQQSTYIEFVLRGGKSGKTVYFNFPSWQSDAQGDYNDFVCVDGLQRITAIQKFMGNEIPAFGSLLREYTDKPKLITASVKVNINNLATKAEVLRWYLEINSGGTVHSKKELDRVRSMLDAEVGA